MAGCLTGSSPILGLPALELQQLAPQEALTEQKGYHHHTKINKIYKINQGYFIKEGKLINNASTDYDLSDKNINPLGGFVHYSDMTNDFCYAKRLHHRNQEASAHLQVLTDADQMVGPGEDDFTSIDPTSKFGLHSFQAVEDKKAFMGPLKKDRITEEEGA
ncbi:hypothetical protein G4228_003891 [Cervus hanglu yarkandensis]|nr:hypothetical protein G4228_003891 [Cervus hanglu yarkandensis]